MRTFNLHIIVWLAIGSLTLIACGKRNGDDSDNSSETIENSTASKSHEKKSSSNNIDIKDNNNDLNVLAKEIANGQNDINNIEKIFSNAPINENSELNTQYRDDLALISNSIQDRMKRLDKIEESINNNENKNLGDNEKKTMLNTVANLKKQLTNQQEQLDKLNGKKGTEKSTSKTTENNIDTTVTNTTINDKTVQEGAKDPIKETTECYFTLGTYDELKRHKIIESGFLQKTKVMQSSSIMHSYFTKADKRTLNEINLHCKNANVRTQHDGQSFSIDDVNGSKVLRIYDQELFWKNTNYLVVETD